MASGMSSDLARERGLLTYAAYLGHAQLAHSTPELVPTGSAFEAYVDRVVDALIA